MLALVPCMHVCTIIVQKVESMPVAETARHDACFCVSSIQVLGVAEGEEVEGRSSDQTEVKLFVVTCRTSEIHILVSARLYAKSL